MLPSAPESLVRKGYHLAELALPAPVREQVARRDWETLDRLIRAETRRGGGLFTELAKYADFSEIEFIIAIRSSRVEPDEDGIWHDDGSRKLAFSLSLTPEHRAVEGGVLEIRRREGGEPESLPTQPFGTLIVFATGQQGFEHRIRRVAEGERIVIAGWCT